MKTKKIVLVVLGLLFAVVLFVFGRQYVIRQLQTRAGIKIWITEGSIQRYVDKTGKWPQSWADLEDYAAKPVDDLAETVIVNWDISIDEILQYDSTDLYQSPPFLVRYAHDIVGMKSEEQAAEERHLNMNLAHSISHATRMRAYWAEQRRGEGESQH